MNPGTAAIAAHPFGAPIVASRGAAPDRFERPKNVEQAARAFEALYLEQLLSEMRRAVPEGGLFKHGFAEKTFQQMLDRSYAGNMAERGGVGLAELLLRGWGVDRGDAAPDRGDGPGAIEAAAETGDEAAAGSAVPWAEDESEDLHGVLP